MANAISGIIMANVFSGIIMANVISNKRQRKPVIVNLETQATFGAQDTGQRQTKATFGAQDT